MKREAELSWVWADADFVLSRGHVAGRDEPVWVVACAPGASLEAPLRLEREFELRDLFESSWALRPLALEDHAGEKRLILSDPGGELLLSCLTAAHELRARLAIAVGAAIALRRLHERELIHRDVHPASLVVDAATGRVWLRGTGHSSRLPRGRQDDARAHPRSGTLEYMSPEQTGRMNRSVDSRSDLYSLGVTLYELFAGKLPFTASEPLEWMHCHVARKPAPLHQVASAIPVGLSAVVHKLLAKTPEDRYQTAAGLEADLRQCLQELEQSGRVEVFPLGSHDASPELRVPERLYGRSRHLEVLHSAFASVIATGHTRIVTISGASGVGKSSLVNELQKTLVAGGGLFAAGKVDQLKRDIPYASVAESCRALVRAVLSRSDAEIAIFRGALKGALGGHGQLMVNLIPELEHLVGKQPEVAELLPEEARGRFHQLFQRFIAVFATREHPLTLFFDDLQWLDAATLELLHALISGNTEHLLLICAYRENEVRPPHPFVDTLELLRKSDNPLEELNLSPLAPEDLAQLIGDALRVAAEDVDGLSRVVHEKTAGNPFFVIQFLNDLADEALLVFDPELGWTWDLERIRAKVSTENVVELMVGKFDRLPANTQRVLQHLACLGRRATTLRLASVCALSAPEIETALWEVARSRLVSPTDVGYAFSHDRVQEASYALIPEQARAALHLKIGRLLASSLVGADVNEDLFEVVHQFDRGATLIESAAERAEVARLYLDAGRRGRQAMAHASARGYFARGRALLGENAWESLYDLCLALELGHAEATFLAGDPTGAVSLLSELARRTQSHQARAAVTRLRIIIHSALDQHLQAVEVCLEFLRGVGIDWTPHPTRELVQQEYEQILQKLGGRSVESLIDLPPMVDQDRRATLDALTAVLPVAIFVDENLNSLALCRMVNMSLAHGNSAGSCFAYVMLGRVLGPYFGDPVAGFRFGRLAFDLLDKPHMSTYRARVSSVFGICIHPWTNHVATSVPLARRAFDIARETGDLTFAAYGCPCLVTLLLASGHSLAEVESEAEAGLAFSRNAKFGQIVDMLVSQIQLIRSLRGLTPSLSSFDEGSFEERAFEQHLGSNPSLVMAACWYWIRKLQGRFLAGDLEAALEAGEQAGALLWTSGAFVDTVDYEYYNALTIAAAFDGAAAERRTELQERLERHLHRLETWAVHCPSNFEPMAALVAAEHARIQGRELPAMRLYERAILTAREVGFVHNEAIAHEVAARFFRSRGLSTSAHAHLTAARSCYRRWGATGKQRQLDRLLPALGPVQEQVAQAPRPSADNVDLATVVKTSQAVSHQVGHVRIVRSLMEVAVEHAGAQRGLLLLESGDEMRIEAEARTRDTVEVEIFPSTAQGALPESVLRYVLRTRETVLLDDGATPHQFSADEYFARSAARSVLCLPIQKQAHLIGVLYLENNLSPYVFTRSRVEVLKLLASQAAISLENALLEEKEALLKEVHHRVKNNLQLISSLLNLQAARVSDPKVAELFADCRHRVRSMALVHENLYQAGNFSQIPMKEHVNTLCAHLSRAYGAASRGIEIGVAVGDLHLEMGRAITCGLIINELVSNALKHAFPDGRAGSVQVELEPLASACLYELSVSDDGVGLSAAFDFDNAETLGLQLVRDLALQLNGEVSARSDAGRTRFAIGFSVAGRGDVARARDSAASE